jgi:hypothetical protein
VQVLQVAPGFGEAAQAPLASQANVAVPLFTDVAGVVTVNGVDAFVKVDVAEHIAFTDPVNTVQVKTWTGHCVVGGGKTGGVTAVQVAPPLTADQAPAAEQLKVAFPVFPFVEATATLAVGADVFMAGPKHVFVPTTQVRNGGLAGQLTTGAQVAPALAADQVPATEQLKVAFPVFPFVDATGTLFAKAAVFTAGPEQVFDPTLQVSNGGLTGQLTDAGERQLAPPRPSATKNCPGNVQLGKQIGAPAALFPTHVWLVGHKLQLGLFWAL